MEGRNARPGLTLRPVTGIFRALNGFDFSARFGPYREPNQFYDAGEIDSCRMLTTPIIFLGRDQREVRYSCEVGYTFRTLPVVIFLRDGKVKVMKEALFNRVLFEVLDGDVTP